MKEINFTKSVNLSKLFDELMSAGLIFISSDKPCPVQCNESEVFVYVEDDTSSDVINQITNLVETHNPTPLPTASSDEVLKSKIEVVTINTLIDLGVF